MRGVFLPLFMALAGCSLFNDSFDDDKGMKPFGVTEEDLTAEPGPSEIHARVISDAHQWRILQTRLDEGRPNCPGLKLDQDPIVYTHDNEAVEIVHFPDQPSDKPYRAQETAYYCRKEKLYYYHYEGGREKRDVWLGPYRVEWNRGPK